jgi:hypothetical protein
MMGNTIKRMLLIIPVTFLLLSGCTSSNGTPPPDTSNSTITISSTNPSSTFQPENQLDFEFFNLAAATMGVKQGTPAYIFVMSNSKSPLPDRWEYYTPFDPKREEKTIEDVDFSKNFLLLISMGFRSVTGPKITVEKIWQVQEIIYVQANFDPGGPTVQPMYSEPATIVLVSKNNMTQFGEITFKLLDQWGNERAGTTCEILP